VRSAFFVKNLKDYHRGNRGAARYTEERLKHRLPS